MLVLVLALVGLAVITATIMLFSSSGKTRGGNDAEIVEVPDDCCGMHDQCEQELKKLSTDIIYFEDEELDVWEGQSETGYDNDAIEQFREVLYTLQKNEIGDWLHSLEMRKVALPEVLKPEVRMLLVE